MEITMEKSGDAVVVSLAGRLDSATSPDAERRLVDALDSGSRFVYDLEHVEYVSSAGPPGFSGAGEETSCARRGDGRLFAGWKCV